MDMGRAVDQARGRGSLGRRGLPGDVKAAKATLALRRPILKTRRHIQHHVRQQRRRRFIPTATFRSREESRNHGALPEVL